MAEPKTKPTKESVREFLDKVEPAEKREDSFVLLEMFEKVTGEKAVMWGSSIVGFGKYHFKSERSSQEGDWPPAGFSPRKQSLTLYVMMGNDPESELFKKLGKHQTSKACLYIKCSSDVDLEVLKEIVERSYKYSKKKLT